MIFRKLRRVARITCERGIRHLLELRCSKRCGPDRVEDLTINDPDALRAAARFNSTTARQKKSSVCQKLESMCRSTVPPRQEGWIAIVTNDAVDAMARVFFSFAPGLRVRPAAGFRCALLLPGDVPLESSDAIPPRESAGAREPQSGVASGEGLRGGKSGREPMEVIPPNPPYLA